MDNRHRKVLHAAIFKYIETSKPISSKQIVSQCGLSASSIRNLMAKLSKDGYLKGVHTSSGKIPTDKGWRCYIDELLEANLAILNKKEELKKNYDEQIKKENSSLTELSKTFFYILEHSRFDLLPKPEKTFFREIILKVIDKKTILGTIFSVSSPVKSFILKTEEPVKQDFLDDVSNLLNKMLLGFTLSEIKNNFSEKIELYNSKYQEKVNFIKNNFIQNFFN
ncbi:MAG: hypothetical protein ABID79_03380 [Elusimicrobiota bacterium]